MATISDNGQRTHVITYETFRKFQRREKENDSLQELPEQFYESCRSWIQRKEGLYRNTREPSLLREIENVISIIKDIMERRERKLMTLALHHIRGDIAPKNLLPSEQRTFDKIVAELRSMREETLERIKSDTPSPDKAAPTDLVDSSDAETPGGGYATMKAETTIAEFIGTDGETYGPYERGDELEVPVDVASLLKRKSAASPME